jgi:hypothetical protein
MSADWGVIFYETLAEYVRQYIEARGNPAARTKILKNCGEEISKSASHEEEVIKLPKDLCWVSILFHRVTCM